MLKARLQQTTKAFLLVYKKGELHISHLLIKCPFLYPKTDENWFLH